MLRKCKNIHFLSLIDLPHSRFKISQLELKTNKLNLIKNGDPGSLFGWFGLVYPLAVF